MFTSPHLARIVEQFQNKDPPTRKRKVHYQLTGNAAVRIAENTKKVESMVKMYCLGNPFINNMPLRSIVSSAEIPAEAKAQILNVDQLGEELYQKFINERLTTASKMSVWDSINLAKFKSMSTWTKKI